MIPTITDNTKKFVMVTSGETVSPFQNITIVDPLVFGPDNSPQPDQGILKIVLTAADGTSNNLGVLSQKTFYTAANFDQASNTITETTAIGPMSPIDPNTMIHGTQYTAPVVAPGQTLFVDATVTYTHVGGEAVTNPVPVVLEVVGPPAVIGNGPDRFLFTVSEDAYRGDAQFTLSIDGVQQGGVQTATVMHASGQTQTFAVEGNFGAGAHTETVNFLNDAYGGTSTTDRNLYVQGISYNGAETVGSSASLLSAGSVSFQTPGAADTLTIGLTEDAYQGNAMASISLDGKTLGTPTVTFLNSAGTAEQFTYSGDFGGTAALHTLSVDFLNDNGGYGATDRNLYIKDLSFDGTTLPATSTLYNGGTVQTTFQNNTVVSPLPTQH